MPATDDTLHSSTSFPTPAGTVGLNAPYERSKKAERLNMSVKHRFATVYDLEAVMCGMRGDKDAAREQHGNLNGREQISMSENPPRGKFNNTPSATIGTHSTPSY